ncbi:MAG: flagellar hook assembly protein FlgD [Deferribacteraceae bacterium]|jgi:flagellar basal-body rod modification protein FlgD|nr:flagellar hook assembly protein FlgD [Deferribacteraceae bacterium]
MQLSKNMPTVPPMTMEQFKESQQKRAVGKDTLDQQDFLNLLITQMKNQDPLNPMDNAQFTQQTTSFSQLEQMINTNKSLETLIELQSYNSQIDQSLMASASFIGRTVEYSANTVSVVNGDVSSLSFYSSADAEYATIKVFNSEGIMVSVIDAYDIHKGNNAKNWNGIGVGGTVLEDGMYTFEVNGKDAAGDPIVVNAYGKGVVKGITISSGQMYFELTNGLVPAYAVYAVKE